MLSIRLLWSQGICHWRSASAPLDLPGLHGAWVVGETYLTNRLEKYKISEKCTKLNGSITIVQTLSIHGRSCYLGQDENNNHYFAKGIGWVVSDGWRADLDNLGILPLWAAERERDVAIYYNKSLLSAVEPITIMGHISIPRQGSRGLDFILADAIRDLDGSPAIPVMYIYRAKCRWRIADMPYLPGAILTEEIDNYGGMESWFTSVFENITNSVAWIHSKGGHDHTLSSHNVFISGERLDFEYAVVQDIPHRDPALNQNKEIWQKKELYSLLMMVWDVAELLNMNWSQSRLQLLIKTRYEEVSNKSFPF